MAIKYHKISTKEELERYITSFRQESDHSEAVLAMLFDFEAFDPEACYLCAEDEHGRRAIMTYTTTLPPQVTSKPCQNTLWLKSIVAMPDAGLGKALILKSIEIANKLKKSGVSLAAFESTLSNRTYSVTPYYSRLHFKFTGDAFTERCAGEEFFYPIYLRTLDDNAADAKIAKKPKYRAR